MLLDYDAGDCTNSLSEDWVASNDEAQELVETDEEISNHDRELSHEVRATNENNDDFSAASNSSVSINEDSTTGNRNNEFKMPWTGFEEIRRL